MDDPLGEPLLDMEAQPEVAAIGALPNRVRPRADHSDMEEDDDEQCSKMAKASSCECSEVAPESTPDIGEIQPDNCDSPPCGTLRRSRDDHSAVEKGDEEPCTKMAKASLDPDDLLDQDVVNETREAKELRELFSGDRVHIRLRNRHGVNAAGYWIALDRPEEYVWVRAKVVSVSGELIRVEHVRWNVPDGNEGRTIRKVGRGDVISAN